MKRCGRERSRSGTFKQGGGVTTAPYGMHLRCAIRSLQLGPPLALLAHELEVLDRFHRQLTSWRIGNPPSQLTSCRAS